MGPKRMFVLMGAVVLMSMLAFVVVEAADKPAAEAKVVADVKAQMDEHGHKEHGEKMHEKDMHDGMKMNAEGQMMEPGKTPEHWKGMKGMAEGKDILGSLTEAIAVMQPTEGSTTKGMVRFKEVPKGVMVEVHIEGLEPKSVHAIHIHEYGDISNPKGLATGDHYNPQDHPHGLPGNMDRHAGDMGNLYADEKGTAHKVLLMDIITIGKPYNPVIGRGVIIHASNDKGTQPVGDAGGRIAQGVIGVANPKSMAGMSMTPTEVPAMEMMPAEKMDDNKDK
ncbi:superoxide dismutase family protein [Poriferisphaera sp. WC338]|uniref:superoxide dismutase family protein n=1 Tax=Poriferisphaera sp. WC338 TaxID=3425129 RepID=UPI003D819EB6